MNKNLQSALLASVFMMLANTGSGAPEPAHSATTQINRLDGEGWLIATDGKNQGREEKWFAAPRPEAKPAAVPGALQEAFPSYYGLVWYWKTFDAPPQSRSAGPVSAAFLVGGLQGRCLGEREGGRQP